MRILHLHPSGDTMTRSTFSHIDLQFFSRSAAFTAAFVALLLIAGVSSLSHAQTFNGGLRGAVTDTSGAACAALS